jgi:hypothetical protein
MISYLTTDACSMFGFLIRRPLNVLQQPVESGTAATLSRYSSIGEVQNFQRSFVS